VPARRAHAAEIPTGARRVLNVATAAGWTVVATYARGTAPTARTWQPGKVIDSLALRMRNGARRAAAVWVDGRFDFAVLFGDRPHQTCNATQLRAAFDGQPVPMREPPSAVTRPRSPTVPAVPASPLPAGTVWGRAHVGDRVRGDDQRAWEVIRRGPAQRWAVGGDAARFVLRLGAREVSVTRALAVPVDLIRRADHGGVARAADVLLQAGFHIEALEEGLTVPDPFTSAAPEPQHDRFGRYLLPDPHTGEERAWTRVSTVARTLADEYHLARWGERMVAKGLALRPDLIAGAAAADPDTDKDTLNSITKQAKDAAASKAGANFGTALHAFTATVDRGETPTAVPPPLDRDLAAYRDLMAAANLRVEHVERVVVLPDLGVAGRLDRIVAQPPGVTKSVPRAILDLKSGKDLSYGWLEIAMQQAMYAHGALMWDPVRGAYEPMPEVDQHRALVLHLPIGQGQAQLYGVNIIDGWKHVELALRVREARSAAKKLAWLVEPDDPATLALHNVSRAASRQELAQLWEQLNKRGLWTEEVNAAAMARFQHLHTVTA
jgi:hypothetical protein